MRAKMRAVLKTLGWALLNIVVFLSPEMLTVFHIVDSEVCCPSHLVTEVVQQCFELCCIYTKHVVLFLGKINNNRN
jgi:hypothetical protein